VLSLKTADSICDDKKGHCHEKTKTKVAIHAFSCATGKVYRAANAQMVVGLADLLVNGSSRGGLAILCCGPSIELESCQQPGGDARTPSN
jgi:hypothetical protein